MDLMGIRRRLLMGAKKRQIINLCPAATGTEIVEKFALNGSAREYVVTGLDPNKDYTFQATWTKAWDTGGSRRLYCVGISASTMIRPTTNDTEVPFTKTVTTKPSADGTLKIWASNTGLTNSEWGAEYAASIVNIMLEEGAVAHPFVPYVGD